MSFYCGKHKWGDTSVGIGSRCPGCAKERDAAQQVSAAIADVGRSKSTDTQLREAIAFAIRELDSHLRGEAAALKTALAKLKVAAK